MSYRLAMWIRENADLPRAQVDVLEAMATHANDDGTNCRPSMERVSYRSRYTRRHVLSVVPVLVAKRILEEVRPATGTRPAEYRIHQSQIPQLPPYDVWLKEHGRGVMGEEPDATSGEASSPLDASPTSEATASLATVGVKPLHPTGETTSPPEVKPFPARGEATAHDSSQDSVIHSINTSPAPNGTGTVAIADDKKIQPYDLVIAMLRVTGGNLSQGAIKQQCGIAKSLVADGITVEDVTSISQWLQSQQWWRDHGIDMKSVKGQLSRWESLGRPTTDSKRATANQPANTISSVSRDQATAERQLAEQLAMLQKGVS